MQFKYNLLLQVVSTNVGGIPEVLPAHLIHLAHPNVASLTKKLELAIRLEETGERVDPWQMHHEVKNTYLWPDVVRRTELVYSRVHQEKSSAELVHRIPKYKKCGLVAGWFMMFLVTLQFLLLKLCDRLWPADDIDVVPDYPYPGEMWKGHGLGWEYKKNSNNTVLPSPVRNGVTHMPHSVQDKLKRRRQ